MNPVSRNSTSIDEANSISKEHHVDIPVASCSRSAQALPLNLPCRDLLDVGNPTETICHNSVGIFVRNPSVNIPSEICR
nr:ankyrin repeat-containing protein [Tanacetum cinerariifolium]